MTEPNCSVFRFSDVEVRERELQLKRGGEAIPVEPKAFRVLMHLLRNPGRLIRKDELLNAGWGNTAVTDNSLTRNIALLRRLLDDDTHAPRYIETVSTVGYRFICSVEAIEDPTVRFEAAVAGNNGDGSALAVSPTVVPDIPAKSELRWRRWLWPTLALLRRGYRFIGELEPPVQPEVPVEPIRTSSSPQTWLKIAGGIFTLVILVVGAVAMYRWFRRPPATENKTENAILNAVPFTTLPGEETSPAFSPDGSRIAFAWNGDPENGGKGFDLYMKAIGSETLLRLTHHPSEWLNAAWSPDGTQIAFLRTAGADTGIYLVPALGGPERKLRPTRISWAGFNSISWSPDGKWIAFPDLLPGVDLRMIYLLSPETLEERRIPNGPKCGFQGIPEFSHSGDYLAFACFRSKDEFGFYSLALASGQAQKVSSILGYVCGLTWSANDKDLISILAPNFPTNQLSEISVENGSLRHITFASNAEQPTVSSKGDKLAYVSVSNTLNIWRRDLLNPNSPAVELVPSTQSQENAGVSPDGKRIVFASFRSGVWGVWTSNVDGSNLVQVSNPHHLSGTPQWSPDGKKVAFDSFPKDRWEIYIADVLDGIPRKLITNISSVYRPHWSRDGKWIYFRSYEAGRTGVYRCPASGGDAIQLSKDTDGFTPQESFDGMTVYFPNHGANAVLKRIALQPELGKEAVVDGLPRIRNSELWTLTQGGIYFVPTEAPRSLRYFDFASRQIRPVFEVDKGFGYGLSVSSDGRWIIYSQVRDVNKDIMLVDHFH